jgi:hypothetical protein
LTGARFFTTGGTGDGADIAEVLALGVGGGIGLGFATGA